MAQCGSLYLHVVCCGSFSLLVAQCGLLRFLWLTGAHCGSLHDLLHPTFEISCSLKDLPRFSESLYLYVLFIFLFFLLWLLFLLRFSLQGIEMSPGLFQDFMDGYITP